MTELEKAQKKAVDEYGKPESTPLAIYAFGLKMFEAGANYQKSLPDTSLEEIKERFYTAAGRGDLQNSTDLVDVDAVWEWIEENCLNAIKTSNTKK